MTENPLGYEKIPKLLKNFAVPSIVASLVGSIYNIVDQIFIGQGVGYLGNAATNVAYPFSTICLAIALLVGIGSASRVSLCLGRKEPKAAAKAAGNGIVLMGIFGIIYLLVGETFLSLLLKAFGATTDVFPYAKQYASITLIGMPFLIVTNGMSNLIRADGKPKYSMVCMVVGAIINTILDPIFIFVCDWGIAGAAWATVIGQIFSFILALRYLWRFQTIHFEKESFLLDIKESMKICSMGISSSSNQIAVTVIQIIQYNSLTYYGALTKYGTDIPLAACGIVMKTNAIILAIVVGISQGTQPIIGFNYGARQYHRVREAYLLAVKWNLVVSTIAFIAFQFFPQSIISLFGDGDELYFEFAVLFMVEAEKRMFAELVRDKRLGQDAYLPKDGSLEYKIMKSGREDLRTLQKIKHNYSWVIGVSKSFNPESCLDHTGKPNSNYIADLPVFQRFIIKPFYECLV